MNGEMDDFDAKEKERRRNDQIEYRKKQNSSNTFLFFGTLFEIFISLLFIVIYFLISAFIVYRILHLSEEASSTVFNILLIFTFIGGLATGFFVYRRLGRWVINKWNLKDKLREDVLNQFKTHKEFKEYYANKKTR